ncbi:hypothetical protein C8R47DRAFT_1217135 [Mycena vitilis]|nr:hypothetical protein C8R47DRAFT_1217135 [Mycena vitilis]
MPVVPPPEETNDACFTGRRLACLAGYRDLPNIYTAMTFNLRHRPRINSRVIRVDGHVYEAWSPNSDQVAFLPGVLRPDYVPTTPQLLAERRYDGHVGRHDCIHAPQYYRDSAKHWPFIRRASTVLPDDYAALAFVPLPHHWRCDDGHKYRGFFDPSFIAGLSSLGRSLDKKMHKYKDLIGSNTWANRPVYTSEAKITHLLSIRVWDDAVDFGVAVQRGLREKEAWVRYVHAVLDQRCVPLDKLLDMKMPFAKEKFIGLWVNGVDEEIVLRYMLTGVPCFVAHEYTSTDRARDEIHGAKVCRDFLEGTEIEEQLGDSNPYQRLARAQGAIDSIYVGDEGRGLLQHAKAVDEMRSSSMFLEQLSSSSAPSASSIPLPASSKFRAADPPSTIGCGSYRTTPASQPVLGASTWAVDPMGWGSTSHVPATPARTNPQPDHTPQSAPKSSEDKYAPRAIEYQSVDPQRSPWIVPPPIASAKSQGKWKKYELGEVNDRPAFIYRGASTKVQSSHLWYDRDNKRRLYFGHFVPPTGVLDEDRFGAPVPRYPFFIQQGEKWVPQGPSHWMYPKDIAPRDEAGKRAVPPNPLRLPVLNGSISDAEESMSHAQEKRKTRAVTQPAEELEDEREEYGMEVDDPDPADIPSNVVAVKGLDDDLSAVAFADLTRDLLFGCRASPLAIIRAQGMIWTRFATITQARLAFGVLGGLAYGIEVRFRPNAEFEESGHYTHDIWSPTTDLPQPAQDVPMGEPSREELLVPPEARDPPPSLRSIPPAMLVDLVITQASDLPQLTPSVLGQHLPEAGDPPPSLRSTPPPMLVDLVITQASDLPQLTPSVLSQHPPEAGDPPPSLRSTPPPMLVNAVITQASDPPQLTPSFCPPVTQPASSSVPALTCDAKQTALKQLSVDDAPIDAPPRASPHSGPTAPSPQIRTVPKLQPQSLLMGPDCFHRVEQSATSSSSEPLEEINPDSSSQPGTVAGEGATAGGKRKRKVRRGTRAGRIALELKLAKKKRRESALGTGNVGASSSSTSQVGTSSVTADTVLDEAPLFRFAEPSIYAGNVVGTGELPPAATSEGAPISLLSLAESGPLGAEDELLRWDEEEIALHWGNDNDDDDRPFAGPFF